MSALFLQTVGYGNNEVHKKCSHKGLILFAAFYQMHAVLYLLIIHDDFADDFAASRFSISLLLSLLSESLVVVCGEGNIDALPLSLSPDSPSLLCEESSISLLLSSNTLSIPKETGPTFGLPPQIDIITSKCRYTALENPCRRIFTF